MSKLVILAAITLLLLTSCSEKVAEVGDLVGVAYIATLNDGTEFEKSEEPIYFHVGSTDAKPIFDKAVRGMKVGEGKQITIPPAKAFGEYDRSKVISIPRSQFHKNQTNQTIELGIVLTLEGKDGSTTEATIVDLNEQNVTLDFNHPLAGETLVFKILLISIE